MERYARKCDKTHEGMNDGWVVNDGEMYLKYENDVFLWAKQNGYDTLEEAFNDDVIYYTEWDEDDIDEDDEPIYEFNN